MLTTKTKISLPKELDNELKREAKTQDLTKSELIQVAIRHYLENKKWKKLQRDAALRADRLGIKTEDDVEALIDEIRT